jgi:hypothetical protein
MSNLKLYENRPNFGSELIICADNSFPYQISKEDFHSQEVSDQVKKRRDQIYTAQALMSKGESNEQIAQKTKLTHKFSPGLYQREFFMPSGSIIIGQRHAREHIVTVLYGSSTVLTEYSSEEIIGPCTFISHAGVKRVLINHTDTVWITTHRTDACSVEQAEAELILNETDIHKSFVDATGDQTWDNLIMSLNQLKLKE